MPVEVSANYSWVFSNPRIPKEVSNDTASFVLEGEGMCPDTVITIKDVTPSPKSREQSHAIIYTTVKEATTQRRLTKGQETKIVHDGIDTVVLFLRKTY